MRIMGGGPEAPEQSRQEGAQTPIQAESSANQIEMLKLEQRKWWISVWICVFLVLAGQSFVSLLRNFYYIQDGREEGDETRQYKGTWTQALAQNAAFPFLIVPLLLLPLSNHNPKPNPNSPNTHNYNDKSHLFKLVLLYVTLGGLLAAHSKLYALGKLYMYAFYALIVATQLFFTSFFGFFINKLRFNWWIVISVILTTLAAAGGIGDFGGAPDEVEEDYERVAWYSFSGNVAFALSLCIMQLGFNKVIPKTTTASTKTNLRTVLETQLYMSFIASLICLIGFFASDEFQELKGDSENFHKGKALYALTLVGLALSWQVWSLGIVGLVLLVSGLFSNVVTLCLSPFVGGFVVAAFQIMDDEFGWFRRGAVVLAVLGFGSYVYTIHKEKKKVTERELSGRDGQV